MSSLGSHQKAQVVPDAPQGQQMQVLLVLLHALRRHHKAVDVILDEVAYQCSGYFAVQLLLGQAVDVKNVIMGSHQLTDSFLVHIAVKLVFDHALVQVVPFQGPHFSLVPLSEQLLNHSL